MTSTDLRSTSDQVTVVVPARNEENHIENCLDSVLTGDHQNLQVLVIDGASTDSTADIVRAVASRDPRVQLIDNPDRLIPVGLNRALAAATGRWMVRVDAHSTIPADYVRRAVNHLGTGKWGAVGGRKDGVGQTPAGHAIAVAMASRFGVGGSTYHHGSELQEVEHVPFGAYPVDLARQLGGWDEELAVNQDFEFDHRVRRSGHPILFDPAMKIRWHCRQTIGELYRQYHRYGRGKVIVMALHPRSIKPRHLAAPALVAWFCLALAMGVRRPRHALAATAPYIGALAVATARSSSLTPAGSRRWLAPAFAAMHIGWGVGFWRGVADVMRDPDIVHRERGTAAVTPAPDRSTPTAASA